MAAEPRKQISWEENVMIVRDQAKLSISHFSDELFSILDPFFKITNQMNKQIGIIVNENDRLIKILKKNKIDYAPEPPKPLTKDQLPAKTIKEAEIPTAKPVTTKQTEPSTKKGILPKK